MKHFMKLNEAPFVMIEIEKKTIELRLYDEKRQQISIGDEIEFSCVSNPERRLLRKVIALHRFDSFKDLYQALPLLKCGYTESNVAMANPTDMELYYTVEQQQKYGVVGLELKLL